MGKHLGVGFIGAGFMAEFHAKSWTGVRNAEIKGVCAHHLESARRLRDLCIQLEVGEPKVFTSVEEMIQSPEIEAVWIISPNYTRISIMESIVSELKKGRCNLKGVACEKPLARNVKEAKKMVELVKRAGLLHGYLENQVFVPSVLRAKEIIWRRGAELCGRPYLVRCAEEHSGPHKPWFWLGEKQGGGVLSDMMCHSIEAARFLLTDPKKDKNSLIPCTTTAEIASLKWTRPRYIERLKKLTRSEVDYARTPVEDFARATIVFKDEEENTVIAETTVSWSFVGPGLRLSFELMGPEYFAQVNTLNPELYVFFSREVKGEVGEDLVEKQTSEQGLMPVLADEAFTYGYVYENRHMVQSFLKGEMPRENWEDGLFVTQLLMSCYMAAEKKRKIKFPPPDLEDFVPEVARGTWDPKNI